MENKSENEQNPRKKIIPRIIIITVVSIALVVIAREIWLAMTHEETDNAQIEMRLVPILARVPGFIDTIFTEDYTSVKKGQLLAVIDSSELVLQLQEMTADLIQGQSDVDNAKAALDNAEASLNSAVRNAEVISLRVEKAKNDNDRDAALFQANAVTKRQYDDSKSAYDIALKQKESSQSDVRVAETRLGILRTQVSKAEAQMQVKKARIEQQKLKLSYCRILATSDGRTGKRNIDQGQFVQAGTPLFTIVNDENFWIIANFKENQIRNIPVGKEVEIKIDGYPKLKIKGKVVSISEATGARFSLLPPDNATGNFVKVTQRIPVRIEFINPGEYKGILRAGMSVVVSVPI